MPVPLPIDPVLPRILQSLRDHPALVLQAPPGAGKTTRVPPALLDAGLAGEGREVVVLEPRRIAARMAARRVALERGGEVGGEVGYRVRYESAVSAWTRLSFETEGVLLRRLLADPALESAGAVVLDEFHERTVDADLALALLREAREAVRPDLRLVVMSATLDPAPIAAYLGGCPVIVSEGRAWPVDVTHRGAGSPSAGRAPGEEPLESRVAGEFLRLRRDGLRGSVLIFLPGAAEIRRAAAALEGPAAREGYDVRPLHGDLPAEEQDRAVRPGPRPRVILATNVAEASITVEGVEAVIDSGLARIARHDPRTELNRLVTARISRASAAQRAGRAGRTGPGRCVRLYGDAALARMPEEAEPEVRRIELSEPVLRILGWGAADPRTFPWLDPPPAERVERALSLLGRLGAAEPARGGAASPEAEPTPVAAGPWRTTPTGHELLRFPLHPRHARILLEAERRGVQAEAARLVALLAERDLRLWARAELSSVGEGVNGRSGGGPGAGPRRDPAGGGGEGAAFRFAAPERHAPSDLLERLDDLDAAARLRFDVAACAAIGIDARAARRADAAARQLRRLVRGRAGAAGRAGSAGPAASDGGVAEEELLRAVVAGYPDRVVRRRAAGSAEGVMVGGAGVRLDPGSAVRGEELYVALEAAPERGPAGACVRVRVASAARLPWLSELFPGLLREEESAAFDPRGERIVARRRVCLLDLPLEERETGQVDPELAARALFAAARRDPDRAVEIDEELQSLLGRLRWLGTVSPGRDAAPPAAASLLAAVAAPGIELPAEREIGSAPKLRAAAGPYAALVLAALRPLCLGARSFAELRRAPLSAAVSASLAPETRRRLEAFAPARIRLPSGRSFRLEYREDGPPILAVRLQELFGASETPRVGAGTVPVLLHLLAPSHRPLQVTQDLASFWRAVYPRLRTQLQRRYPKHAWPEDPLRAAPPPARPGRRPPPA